MIRRLALLASLTTLSALWACGDDASSGATGATGPAGSAGSVGSTGPAGSAGPAGSPGAKGVPGAEGPAGPKGDPGPVGPGFDAGPPLPTSCLAIKSADAAATDGVYELVLAGLLLRTTCNMTDGGWTMIASFRASKVPQPGTEIVNGIQNGRYMPEIAVRELAAASARVRLVQTAAPASYYESLPDTTPILQLRKLLRLQDDATMETSAASWTANGTLNLNDLNYTCATGTRGGYPDLYWACGNGTGTHVLPLDGNVRLASPAVDVSVYVK